MSEEEIIRELEKIEDLIKKTLKIYSETQNPKIRKEVVNLIRDYLRELSNVSDELLIIYSYLLFCPNGKKNKVDYLV
ncbi:MAG: hypothetical protein QXG39_00305 [Candidatus Aenigmatarchaeota archaeon]